MGRRTVYFLRSEVDVLKVLPRKQDIASVISKARPSKDLTDIDAA